MAPMYFSHARYGLYFSDLIIPDAQTEALNPLFVFSIVRQESFFEGFVHSTAGARGLMQIIPSTGASIAADLRWPFGYEDVDLYRPDVSIRLGTHYLASNLAMMGGDPFSALAAYNAGPGNAAAWKEIAGGDPDLYLEVVRFEETRLYIRNIYEIYSIYRRLYGTS
jgi:soluble lytic murein transglycosylase